MKRLPSPTIIRVAMAHPFLRRRGRVRGGSKTASVRVMWGLIYRFRCRCRFFSFTGWRGSFFGDLHTYGKQAIQFYTETKTITARWPHKRGKASANMTIRLK